MKTQRIESVDILRGFTITAMILVNTPGSWSHVYTPLLHAEWHGLTPTDLIFPFFLFIVGISIYFSFNNKSNSSSTYKKIIIRSLKLLGLGLFLNAFSPNYPFVEEIAAMRFPGILQRIGCVFLVSSILFLNCNWKSLLVICVSVLIGYWLFIGFMPFPNSEIIRPTFDRAPNNWVNYIDLKIFGNHLWQKDYDPEGFFSTIPAIISCVFGILVAHILHRINLNMRVIYMVALSLILFVLGYVFNNWFPINKAIWSSSFVLVTTGWATLILAAIYFLTDILNFKFGSIFKYVGMNAIGIYFISSIISKSFYLIKVGEYNIHSYMYDSIFVHSVLSDKLASLLYALTAVMFYLFLSYFLAKKKIFIKV